MQTEHQVKTGIRALLVGCMAGGALMCHSVNCQTATAGMPAKVRTFTMPAVPPEIVSVSERADYLAAHYWDLFDFADTAYIHLPEVTEQAFVDYLSILPYASGPAAREQSVRQLLAGAEGEESGRMYGFFLEILAKYLHEPNSPFRDDELYIPVAHYLIADAHSGEAEKIRMRYTLKGLLKNRPGTVAADFAYVLPDGRQGRLHDIAADCTLLMFYNPDCHACGEIIASIRQSSAIRRLTADGKLAILLFYPDEDVEIWKAHWADIPKDWINGYDRQLKVKNSEIYDLRAIPSLYLLGRDKTVLLKDVNFDRLERFLTENFGK
ncbi:MAG: DUF5106 domain-containing protein [Tannerella sp.]|nr:DUF5106 domain-containing protein [Tannerella sp.]